MSEINHFIFKIQICSCTNFLDTKCAEYLSSLDHINKSKYSLFNKNTTAEQNDLKEEKREIQ